MDTNHSFIDNLCITSIYSHCHIRCKHNGHISSNIPIYDGHIYLNQTIPKIQSDLISAGIAPPIREFYFTNNNQKPNEWLILNPSPFLSYVHIYPTFGIHSKYFHPKPSCQISNDLENCLDSS